ncbi:MAG TPA: Gfo/Idh/MocA family oxidoreductase, partial [bacterium]|nr:Gfo/Idh/MocA family oxidoreductase [bacterium]
NLLRNLSQLPVSRVKYCCDLDDARLSHMKTLYPQVSVTKRFEDLIEDEEVKAIAIATPVSTHYPIAKACLQGGKHVLIEKPLAASIAEAEDLNRIAKAGNVVLFAGHTFIYNAAVQKMKDLVESGELGETFYVSSIRVNLGLFQEDINVIWDLAPHDISILNYIFGRDPVTVSTFARSYIRPGIEDVAFITLQYPKGVVAHIHVSWLDPCKIRRTTLVGSKKMLVYDDTSTLEKIRVYDKGVTIQPHYDTFGEFQLAYRFGDIIVPKINDVEPLKVECLHFMECVRNGGVPKSDGTSGLSVVKVVERACESAKLGGAPLALEGNRGGSK